VAEKRLSANVVAHYHEVAKQGDGTSVWMDVFQNAMGHIAVLEVELAAKEAELRNVRDGVQTCVARGIAAESRLSTLSLTLGQVREKVDEAPHAERCKKRNCACEELENTDQLCKRCPCDCFKTAALSLIDAALKDGGRELWEAVHAVLSSYNLPLTASEHAALYDACPELKTALDRLSALVGKEKLNHE